MPFVSHLVIDESVQDERLPLTRNEISKLTQQLARLVKDLPETRMWKQKMGAAAQSWTLCFCDDRVMKRYQKKYRHLNRTTDVLSFPSCEQAQLVKIFSKLPKSERSLGDVVVSLPAVRRGAKRGRRSFRQEFLDVLVHSFLHLLGFDHVVGKRVTQKAALRMRDLQKRLFQKLIKSIS